MESAGNMPANAPSVLDLRDSPVVAEASTGLLLRCAGWRKRPATLQS